MYFNWIFVWGEGEGNKKYEKKRGKLDMVKIQTFSIPLPSRQQ
jgi:hypothetical protein